MNKTELRKLLAAYDGRDVEAFRQAARQVAPTDASLRRLLDLARNEIDAVEIGATWVFKKLLEDGAEPQAVTSRLACRLLAEMRCAESQLHLLQSLPLLSLSEREARSLYEQLRELIGSEHKFVRAWAYNGLAVAAGLDRSYRAETLELFAEAKKHEAASIKARIRHAEKTLAD